MSEYYKNIGLVLFRLSTLWPSVKFPVNGTEEEEKQPSATHIVILLDILMFTDCQIQTTFATTSVLLDNLAMDVSQV